MKLHEVKNRVLELDTKTCVFINNHLWNRDKIQFINGGKQFLAPKYYSPQHISQVKRLKLLQAKQRLMRPLKNLKGIEPTEYNSKKSKKFTEGRYDFHAYYLTEEQYNKLYGFYYSKIRPNTKRTMKTVEQIEKSREKK